MKYEETICHKTDMCLTEIKRAVNGSRFDPVKVADLLVSIRSDAIRMENSLKVNKQLREKYNLDAEYKELVGDRKTTAEINQIRSVDKKTDTEMIDAPRYEMVLKDETGKVIYQNSKLFAFIFSAVERIEGIDKDGIIDGSTQIFGVGHDLAVWFAYDQFRQKFGARFTGLLLKMRKTAESGGFMNREMRRKYLKSANGLKSK